ncbi:histidine kinase [Microbacterium sp. cx-55]|uniref:sensor histidine kinase n=1 Tax=Microbacterium sp. cx-55 TaxID=2875948 RepID=UPI001CBC30BB|nr:histidine kinase [Microbacterium sp. cx-55]MBZ4487597.1 sensor histidine kinase [Microbacterium sp. cx-55]UGB35612.1 histidine kinase [Microbacterium sp. cx-55]
MFRPLKTWQLVVDVGGALVFIVLFGGLFASGGADSPLQEFFVALGMAAALAVRRKSPALSLAVAWVTAIAQMALGMTPTAANLAVFGVLYVTAAYGSRLVFWLGFASSFVGAAAIALYLVVVIPAFAGSTIAVGNLPIVLLVMLAAGFALLLSWTAGALVRTAARAAQNRIARDRAQGEAAAEQERVRIARDMHDVVAHSLAVVIAQADGARYAAAADPSVATAALSTISTTARAALADVRMLLTQLRHSQGDGPQPGITDLDDLFAQVRAAGVDLRIEVAPLPPDDVPASVQLAVFRILQEALTNALRHGGAGPVRVHLAWHGDRCDLAVRNPLPPRSAARAGLDIDAVERGPGHGIIGMRERAQLVGGSLRVGPDDDQFVVTATLPIGERS